ncbi:MAG TPA: serine/threonine-protein kinase, partial [Polyangia bacterium]
MRDPSSGESGAAPRQFGRYRVVRALGAGAMGDVYLAHDELLAREVAIKAVRLLGAGEVVAEAFRARFLHEARAVAALAHPNVVRLFDLGFEGGTPYLVMEVASGPSLRERLARGRLLSGVEARALGVQIGRALEAAHAQGILHRDVKPGNVLEAEPGTWKLADFGVARLPDSALTVTGQFVGSPAYAPPEALLAGEFSPATDVYGLAATLYEGLCGATPYGDPGGVSEAARARAREPVPLTARRADVPPEVARVVARGLRRDPRARPTAGELAAELADATAAGAPLPPAPAAAARPRRRHPRAAALALAGAAAALALAAGLVAGLGGWGPGRGAARGPARADAGAPADRRSVAAGVRPPRLGPAERRVLAER